MKHYIAAIVAVIAMLLLAASPDAARPIADRVVITRDTYGVPHIAAETEEAAGFGLGYAQAEDHIDAIARRVLRARGVAARVFGAAALDNDFAMTRLDNIGESRRHLRELDRKYRAVLTAFTDGVNLYAAQHRQELPEWVPQFEAADFLAAVRAGSVESVSSPALLKQLAAKYPSPAPPPLPGVGGGGDFPGEPGSNALALAGTRTVSGHPILLGNPHLRWEQLYWEAHVIVPGRLNFYGSTLAGFPWLRAGFNDRLAYVQTNNAPDLEDLLALSLDPAKADRYIFDGRSRPLLEHDVAVEVRQESGEVKVEHRTFWSSELGPIVYRDGKHAFAYRSTALDAWRFFEGFWRLSHARSLADFRSVMSRALIPTSNFTYADAAGNILYLWNARLPRRPVDGTDYALDVPGDPAHLWHALHRLEDLPQLLNPPGGYVQNANNPPWFASRHDPIDQARYAPYFERGELALRPQLAIDLIESRDSFDVDDVIALKFSNRLLLAERVKADLIAAADGTPNASADLREGRDIIRGWDATSSSASVGGVVFQRFWDTYRGAVREPFAVKWDPARPYETPSGLSDPAAAAAHLEEAVRWTRQTYGSARVKWGDAHRFRFGDIDLPGDGAAGQLGAYRVVQFDPVTGTAIRVAGRAEDGEMHGFGDAWILLVHFTRPLAAYSVLAYGESSRAGSAHGSDQIRLFASHRLRPIWFRPEEIAAHVERTYTPARPYSISSIGSSLSRSQE